MPSNNQALIGVSPQWHKRLMSIAGERTSASGKRVTMRELAEAAFRQVYGLPTEVKNAELPPRMNLPLGVDQDDVFTVLVGAALEPDNAAIEALDDASIEGTLGQKLEMKKLAYWLRTADKEIGDIGELIRAYEAGS